MPPKPWLGIEAALPRPAPNQHRAPQQIGPEASMTYNFKEGDLTHFNRKGAMAIAGLILEELKTVLPDVASYVKVSEPAE